MGALMNWKAKRFWTDTTVEQVGDGWTVLLDGRKVKTPAKTDLVVPSRAYAEAIAEEWEAQEGEINPNTMPVTRSANAAIDKVSVQFVEVADMLAEYGGSDLLCYRAEAPAELAQRQAENWDPILEWARQELDAELKTATGIMHVAQPSESAQKLSALVHKMTPFELASFHDLVSISGSLILGFAVTRRHLAPEVAWDKARIDEIWQEEQWGADDEATAVSNLKKAAFLTASTIFSLSQS